MTKREYFAFVTNLMNGAEVSEEDRNSAFAFMDKEIAALDAKNEKAKERAAAKKAEGDALKERIAEVIDSTPMTINEIIESLGEEGLTPAKVVARVRHLVSENIVTKSFVKVEGRKLTAYSKA